MKIVITSTGNDLDALTSPVFGRCQTYIVVDTETTAFEALPNPAIGAGGGAGVQAAQFIVSQGIHAVVSGNVGPNAYRVLHAAGVAVWVVPGGTVRDAIADHRAGRLVRAEGATVASHTGGGHAGAPGGRRGGGV